MDPMCLCMHACMQFVVGCEEIPIYIYICTHFTCLEVVLYQILYMCWCIII